MFKKKLKLGYQFENYCFKLYLRQDFRVHTLLHYSCLIACDDLLSDKHFLKATINTSDSVEDRYTQISEFCIFFLPSCKVVFTAISKHILQNNTKGGQN